ncbi:DEAD/DEAH box helicase family protein [Acetivibrio straminisolvens]|uniref:DEAD/DEAH box helicase family protein n=1 Tax=Acetivibrio straminisolvens TaxID=253314 RepID=UPI00223EF6B1|nr:DEAD/DEAH box helicase family protein [Acetivibrio straminisolvens]
MSNVQFDALKFKYPFRKHQEMILQSFKNEQLKSKNGPLHFHVVAPPGAGKTIVGLECVIRLQSPAVIICPNTAIQGQWVDKFDLFIPEGSNINKDDIIGSNPNSLKPINVFTYQVLSIPDNDTDSYRSVSENMWAESISESLGIAKEEALDRIQKMKEKNLAEYNKEISKYTKKLRNSVFEKSDGDFLKILHPNTRGLIRKLKEMGVKTVVFDECHHLKNYWAVVMREIIKEIEATNIIGLTATPPSSDEGESYECYTALLGEIDFQLPTPAVVKDGMLSPYQDLVYFCLPTQEELKFIEDTHERYKKLIENFDKKGCDFYNWIEERIVERKLVSGGKQDWTKFINSRPGFAAAGVKYLIKNDCKLPWDITITEDMYNEMTVGDWCYLIEDFALHKLKVSDSDEDKVLYEDIKLALRSLGFILTERGIRNHNSPVDRVLAYSKSKLLAVKDIIKEEMLSMGDKLRVAVITDFEISNALSLKKVENVLDEESGGAVSVLKELVADPEIDKLNPIMVTAKNLLCDDDISNQYVEIGTKWAKDNSLDIKLEVQPGVEGLFCAISGSGKDWNSKTAVLFTTYLLEEGVTKCLIGTRGLFSEGWDSIALNTLIDLSTATTFASVNQLRGRSIRKNEKEPQKLANNWDIVCIAPGLERGYNDLERLLKKHKQFYGICEDGRIQQGIDHVDAALSFNETKIMQEGIQSINARMLKKLRQREDVYKAWKIGEPFSNIEVGCCELKLSKPCKMKTAGLMKKEFGTLGRKLKLGVVCGIGSIGAILMAAAGMTFGPFGTLPVIAAGVLMGVKSVTDIRGFWKYGNDLFMGRPAIESITDISKCLFYALKECGFISRDLYERKITVTERADGSLRVYLEASKEDSQTFAASLAEILAPIEDQRYAVQRYEEKMPEDNFERLNCMIGWGLNKSNPQLVCYHPLPSLFNHKDKALVFKKYWNRYVSPGDIVYLKGEEGKKVVENYGRVNFLGSKKQLSNIWM